MFKSVFMKIKFLFNYKLKILSVCLIILIFFNDVFSQHANFIKYYFDNYKQSYASDIIHTTDNCYIMVGVVWDFASTNNYYILKTNSVGDTLWYRENKSVFLNEAIFVIETSDSDYVFSTTLYQIHLVKYDKNGNLQWEKGYTPVPGDPFTFNSLVEVNQKLYAFGTHYTPNNTLEGVLFKTNIDGDSILTMYNTSFTCGNNINAAIKYQNDKIAMSGYIYDSTNSNYIARLSIIDTNGSVLLNKPIQSSQETFGFIIRENFENGFYFSTLGSSQYICKMDSMGNVLWSTDFGVGADKYYLSIIDTNTLLLMGHEFVYLYISDSGQYLSYNPFDFPFNFNPPHISNTIVNGNKIIMGGSTQDPIALNSESFIVEYDISNITSVTENIFQKQIFAFPNPVLSNSGVLNIVFKGNSIKQLYIFNYYGQLFDQIKIGAFMKNQIKISIEKYKSGIYFIKSIDENDFIHKTSFVVY